MRPCVATGREICVAELASAEWSGPPWSWTGQAVASGTVHGQAVVIVGSPRQPPALATVLRAGDLAVLGAWVDHNTEPASSTFGEAIAVSPDGDLVAVGADSGGQSPDQSGRVFVFAALPSGTREAASAASLVLNGDLHDRANFGNSVQFLDLTGNGLDLVVGAGNVDWEPEWPNAIYRFDDALTGEHGVSAALGTIASESSYRLGQYLEGWDADGDGLDELVSAVDIGLAHFPTPWLGDLIEDDADAVITGRDPIDQFGASANGTVGDIDGAGGEELAVGANTYSATVERAGALYLVPAGSVGSGSAEELPYRFIGTTPGAGLGRSVASGDVDGDGDPDLLVGATDIPPSEGSGGLVIWYGPLAPGVRTTAEADLVVLGETSGGGFGSDVVSLVSDSDGLDDLVVSAHYAEDRGKVYLIFGADIASGP